MHDSQLVTLDFQLEEERQNSTALFDNQSLYSVEPDKTVDVQVSIVVFVQVYSLVTWVASFD